MSTTFNLAFLFCILIILVCFFYFTQRVANKLGKNKWKVSKEEKMLKKMRGGII